MSALATVFIYGYDGGYLLLADIPFWALSSKLTSNQFCRNLNLHNGSIKPQRVHSGRRQYIISYYFSPQACVDFVFESYLWTEILVLLDWSKSNFIDLFNCVKEVAYWFGFYCTSYHCRFASIIQSDERVDVTVIWGVTVKLVSAVIHLGRVCWLQFAHVTNLFTMEI